MTMMNATDAVEMIKTATKALVASILNEILEQHGGGVVTSLTLYVGASVFALIGEATNYEVDGHTIPVELDMKLDEDSLYIANHDGREKFVTDDTVVEVAN